MKNRGLWIAETFEGGIGGLLAGRVATDVSRVFADTALSPLAGNLPNGVTSDIDAAMESRKLGGLDVSAVVLGCLPMVGYYGGKFRLGKWKSSTVVMRKSILWAIGRIPLPERQIDKLNTLINIICMGKIILSVLSLILMLSCNTDVKENIVQPNIMETNKKNLGNLLALYPKPMTVVGAEVEGKVNWLVVGHTGVIGHDRVLVSMSKRHYTNQGI